MPRDSPPFSWKTIVSLAAAVPLLTIGGNFVVNYISNGDKLAQHDIEIKQEQVERNKLKDAEDEKREILRKALNDYADKTAQSVAALATHAAVQDEQIKNISNNLDKAVNVLQGIEIAISRDKRSENDLDGSGTMTDWQHAMRGRGLVPN